MGSMVTEKVSEYIAEKGISIKNMSEKTGVAYGPLIASLTSKGRDRDLRDDEFLKICAFLELDPFSFAPEEWKGERRWGKG